MARPKKWRRVGFVPDVQYFVPADFAEDSSGLAENHLKVEELEAIRLKDLEGLEQHDCGLAMEVSRQTFQRILNSARAKIADSLVNGKAIRIEGGNYTRNICCVVCLACGNQWTERYEDMNNQIGNTILCEECGSPEVICSLPKRGRFCHRHCRRHGRQD